MKRRKDTISVLFVFAVVACTGVSATAWENGKAWWTPNTGKFIAASNRVEAYD